MLFSFEGDAEPTPPEGLVTVGRFGDPVEAQIARGLLETAGVETFMVGENMNNVMPGAFRCRVQVRVEDELEARELLDTSGPEDEDGR
jgi:Putative prokaryotic signal transducing protein